MAKFYGPLRLVERITPGTYDYYRQHYIKELQKDDVVPMLSYMSDSGAYVIYHKNHNFDQDELDAARIMADNGIIVHLTSERDISQATATFINRDGDRIYKFSDGRLTINSLSYEQSTRSNNINTDPDAGWKWVKKALRHGQDKRSKIAVLYDKGGTVTRENIAKGIQKYEEIRANTHRFNTILVISKNGKVYEWRHNI